MLLSAWKKGSEWWANYIEDGVNIKILYMKLIQGKVSEES